MTTSKDLERPTKFLFTFVNADRQSKIISNMLAIVSPYLLEFYSFLSEFGMYVDKNKMMNEDQYYFKYEQVIQKEKELQKQIEIFLKTIKVIQDFIKEGTINGESLGELSKSCTQLDLRQIKTRQSILKDSQILLYLCYIANLIGMLTTRNRV